MNTKNPNILSQDEIESLPNSFYSHAEAIYHLNEVGIEVKQTRVAEWLGVSRANVSQVIGRMQNNGLIELTDELKLSKKGAYLAKIISRRHRIIERFLSEVLDLPGDKVYKETKKWENIFLQKNQMLPGNNIFISDTNKYSITVSVTKNQYFGLDQYIAERVFVG